MYANINLWILLNFFKHVSFYTALFFIAENMNIIIWSEIVIFMMLIVKNLDSHVIRYKWLLWKIQTKIELKILSPLSTVHNNKKSVVCKMYMLSLRCFSVRFLRQNFSQIIATSFIMFQRHHTSNRLN